MNHAVFWVIPKSRCSFMLDTPLRFVEHRYRAITHLRSGSRDDSMTVPVRTEKYLRHAAQR